MLFVLLICLVVLLALGLLLDVFIALCLFSVSSIGFCEFKLECLLECCCYDDVAGFLFHVLD